MKTNPLQNGWAVPLLAAGVAGGYFFLLFLPQQRSIAKLTADLVDKKAAVEQAEALMPAVAATEELVRKTRDYDAAWEATSPSDANLAQLFGEIYRLAKTAGVTTTRFTPETPDALAHVRRIPLAITCTGEFNQIARFLESVERLPQTIWIGSLRMEVGKEDGKNVQCEVALEIFADNPEDSDQVNLAD